VVVAAVGTVKPVLTGIQWVGTGLAVGVGGLIAVVTVVIVWFALTHALVPPTLPTDADSAAKVIANFKLLSDVEWSGPSGLFDTVVVKALLPIFTAILGYIFGSRVASKEEG
jgi:hypothetical protein